MSGRWNFDGLAASKSAAESKMVNGRSEMCGEMERYIRELQVQITSALEDLDGQGKFLRDDWQKPAGGVSPILFQQSALAQGASAQAIQQEGDARTL